MLDGDLSQLSDQTKVFSFDSLVEVARLHLNQQAGSLEMMASVLPS